jgi:hypothetical protein
MVDNALFFKLPTTPYLGSVTLHFGREPAFCQMESREKSNFRLSPTIQTQSNLALPRWPFPDTPDTRKIVEVLEQ